MSVSCERCVLSGRGVCDGPIPRPEEYYRVGCVDVEASTVSRPRPTTSKGLSSYGKNSRRLPHNMP